MLTTSVSNPQSTNILDETLDRISVLKKNAGKCQFMLKLWSFIRDCQQIPFLKFLINLEFPTRPPLYFITIF